MRRVDRITLVLIIKLSAESSYLDLISMIIQELSFPLDINKGELHV